MAKFYGAIGFAEVKETAPGVWSEEIIDHNYYGDIIRNTRRLQTSDGLNDNINISNEISILSDPYANENFHSMRYIVFMNTKWKITEVSVQDHRLILTIGGQYNE